MRLFISVHRTIGQVEADFERCFPYLKLKFFKSNYLPSQTSLWDEEIQACTSLGQLKLPAEFVIIDFAPSFSVATFEKLVFDKSGLFVKVFRLKNHDWVEIKNTKDSLERFNRLGMASEFQDYNYHTLFL